jgi:hypothetical protein
MQRSGPPGDAYANHRQPPTATRLRRGMAATPRAQLAPPPGCRPRRSAAFQRCPYVGGPMNVTLSATAAGH